MRIRLLAAAMGASALVALPAAAQIGGNYNALFFGSFSNSPDVEGRLAAGGAISLSGFGVGAQLGAANGTPTVVGGGSVMLTNGQLSFGGLTSAGAAVLSSVGLGGPQAIGTPLNFVALQAQAIAQSNAIAALAASGGAGITNSFAFGTRTLAATGAAGTYVFAVDPTTLASTNGFTISAPVGSTVFVNLVGSGSYSFMNAGFSVAGVNPANVLLNFNGAIGLTMSGASFEASVLAPTAAISLTNGHIKGDVVGASGTGNGGGEYEYRPFVGIVPTAVPEPATLALVAGGLALVGVTSRRRRALS